MHARALAPDNVFVAGPCPCADALPETIVEVVPEDRIFTNACEFKALDMETMVVADHDFTAPFEIVAARDGPCHALVISFKTDFTAGACAGSPVTLDTMPSATPTHWKQTVIVFKVERDASGGGHGQA